MRCRIHLLIVTWFAAVGAVGSVAPAAAGVLITVDKSSQRMSVAVDGRILYQWPVSTGRGGYATPSGTFKTFRMEADHYSKEWDDAPMPHSIFFTMQGHAIHGSFDVRRLGTPASHGCVRLAPANAARLFALVKAEGLGNTRVVLGGEEPVIARRARPSDSAATPRRLRRVPDLDPYALPPDGEDALRISDEYGRPPAGWR